MVYTLVLGTRLSPLLEGLGPPPARPRPGPGGTRMVASQCGNDRPGFGLLPVSQKLRAYNIIRVLNILKLKLYYIIMI